MDDLGYTDDGIAHVTISVGYMQQADVPSVLAAIPDESFESPIDFENASYFLSTIDIEMGDGDQRTAERGSGMPRWRRRLFVAISALTADAAEYFNLPRDRTASLRSAPDAGPHTGSEWNARPDDPFIARRSRATRSAAQMETLAGCALPRGSGSRTRSWPRSHAAKRRRRATRRHHHRPQYPQVVA